MESKNLEKIVKLALKMLKINVLKSSDIVEMES
jgi:hypothetical protein